MDTTQVTDSFVLNSTIARSLIKLLTREDQGKANAWMRRLHAEEPLEDITMRNEYMWVFINDLRNRRLFPPFSNLPPNSPLRSMEEILADEDLRPPPPEINFDWIDAVIANPDEPPQVDPDVITIYPRNFLKFMPVPLNGSFCYMGAFSELDTDPKSEDM